MTRRPIAPARDRRAGFSLIEILVVITIITILTGVVAVKVIDSVDQARVTQTLASMENLTTALEKYYLAEGVYPTQRQGLEALAQPSATPPRPRAFPEGGYISRLPLDGWGRPIQYLAPARNGQPFELLSLGKDGEPGGEGVNADLSTAQ